MKFYYNGKLIRTSKTRNYNYALLNEKGGCYSCSEKKDRLISELVRLKNEANERTEGYKKDIEIIEKGGMIPTYKGSKKYWENDQIRKFAECNDRYVEALKNYKIVELEKKI